MKTPHITVEQLLNKLHGCLNAWRQEVFSGYVNHATGKVDDAGARELLAEYDQLLAEIQHHTRSQA